MSIRLLSGLGCQPKHGCEQVPTSFGESEPFGTRTSLLQLAGPTCSAVNRWAGRECSRALLTNYRCVGGAEARDGQTGWR